MKLCILQTFFFFSFSLVLVHPASLHSLVIFIKMHFLMYLFIPTTMYIGFFFFLSNIHVVRKKETQKLMLKILVVVQMHWQFTDFPCCPCVCALSSFNIQTDHHTIFIQLHIHALLCCGGNFAFNKTSTWKINK